MVARKKSSHESKKDRTPPPSSPQTPYETQTIIKNAVPNVEERRARFGRMDFKLTKEEQRGLRRQPILITAPPPVVSPYTLAHRRRVFRYTAKKHVQQSNEAELPRQTVVSPPILMGTQSVAASESGPRAPDGGEHARATASRANQRHSGGARGYGPGIESESQGPLSALPHPIIPDLQAAHPPNLTPALSSLVDRPKRSYHRDRRGPNFPGRLASPDVNTRQRPTPYDKPRAPNNTSRRIKASVEASAPRATGASTCVPGTNTVDLASSHLQPGLVPGSAQIGASYAPWTRMQHFSTTAVYPTLSERQHHGCFIPSHVFGAHYLQQHSGMASSCPPAGKDQNPQDMQSAGAWNVRSPEPRHNARAPVDDEMGTTCVQPASRGQSPAHDAADGRALPETSSLTSHDDPAPSVHPRETIFDEQEDTVWAGMLAGSLAPVESAAVCVGIPAADLWATEVFASPDGAILCDTFIVNIGLESQPDSEGSYHSWHAWHASNPPASAEWPGWWNLPSPISPLPNSIVDSELCSVAPPRMRVSTYSSLEGAVSGFSLL